METSSATHSRRPRRAAMSRWFIGGKWALLVSLVVVAGCATQQIGHEFDETKLSSFKPHQTTLDEVVATLGQPTERETEIDGSVRLHYQWIKGGGGVSSYVPVVSLFHTSVHTDAKDAFLYFGPDHRYIRAEQNEMHSS